MSECVSLVLTNTLIVLEVRLHQAGEHLVCGPTIWNKLRQDLRSTDTIQGTA